MTTQAVSLGHQQPLHLARCLVDTQRCSIECVHELYTNLEEELKTTCIAGDTQKILCCFSLTETTVVPQNSHKLSYHYAFLPQLLKGRPELSLAPRLVRSVGSRLADNLAVFILTLTCSLFLPLNVSGP